MRLSFLKKIPSLRSTYLSFNSVSPRHKRLHPPSSEEQNDTQTLIIIQLSSSPAMEQQRSACPHSMSTQVPRPRVQRSHSMHSLFTQVVPPTVRRSSSDSSNPNWQPPRSPTSASKPSRTVKPVKVSSGNLFYAEVIRQRLKEDQAQVNPTTARDLPTRGSTACESRHSREVCPRSDVKAQIMKEEAKRSSRTSPAEEGEVFCVASGFARVPSSTYVQLCSLVRSLRT